MKGGFAITPVWLLDDTSLTVNEKIVYVALTSFTNSEGYCFPSHAKLAERGSISIATVKRALKRLRERGLVDWKNQLDKSKGQLSNYYKVEVQTYPPSLTGLPPLSERANPPVCVSDKLNPINNTNLTRDIPPGQKTPDDTLADFIRAYPKRTMPETITTAWRKALKHTTGETLIKAAEAYAQSVADTPPRFIKNASTWLNTHSWLDDYKPANTNQQAIWAEIPDDEEYDEEEN